MNWFASEARIWFLSVVSTTRTFFKYWLPLLAWMAVVFSASADTRSYQHSSRILGPLLRWMFPGIDPGTEEALVELARKMAHLTEYAILAFLFWRATWRPQRKDPRPWSWRHAAGSVLFVMLYAATDELHQVFVPTRGASVWDVVIDTIGAMGGMWLVWRIWLWRGKDR